MPGQIHVGVMGAGSIGCFVGGSLLSKQSAEVTFVGRARVAQELAQHGLTVKNFNQAGETMRPERVTFVTDPSALRRCDAVLVCVKSAQSRQVAAQLAQVLHPHCVVASLQNGVCNADLLREQLGAREVMAGIVGFNVVARGAGLFHRAMSGSIMFETPRSAATRALVRALGATKLDVETRNDLAPDQYTKLMVNLNNAVSALSGAPTRQLLLSPGYRQIIAALISEALFVLQAARIRPAKLRGIPIGLMPHILRLPTPLVRLVTRAQMRVDPEARSSMWEDLTRHKKTEVDFLNGEIVRLAAEVGAPAPINTRIVELVHAAEDANAGPPHFNADNLWERLIS